MFLNYGNKITGLIDKDLFDRLTNVLKEEFLETVRINSTVGGSIHFDVPNRRDADELSIKIRNFEKNKNRSESRKENMYVLSSGIYGEEDINSIFEAQEGLCYYTGQSLKKSPKNYAIDHIIPVTEGGSSWPVNLVLATIEINREKHNHSKRKIFSVLEKRNGKEWIKKQREFCKKVDAKRRSIDKSRRAVIKEMLENIETSIRETFPNEDIDYGLIGDDIELYVNHTVVGFPAGFVREKNKCFSSEYISNLIFAILSR